MNPITHDLRRRPAADQPIAEVRRRDNMEATARLHFAAEHAHVDEAMAGVRWERRGPLQRLTRDAR